MNIHRSAFFICSGFISLVVSLFYFLPVLAAVTLASFTATARETEISIDWETATEFDTAGFYVMRSLEETGSYQDISPFYPAIGFGVTGAEYQFVDTDVQTGTTYYYKLRVINNDMSEQVFGPVFATPGVLTPTPSQTVAPTESPTSQFSPTATLISAPTRTPTRTPTITPTQTPTRTPIVQPTLPTWTPSPSPTNTAIPSPTSSPTFAGFEAATITPDLTKEGTELQLSFETPEAQPVEITQTSDPAIQVEESAELVWDWSRAWLLLVVGLLWVMLGLWLVYYLSQTIR